MYDAYTSWSDRGQYDAWIGLTRESKEEPWRWTQDGSGLEEEEIFYNPPTENRGVWKEKIEVFTAQSIYWHGVPSRDGGKSGH